MKKGETMRRTSTCAPFSGRKSQIAHGRDESCTVERKLKNN